MSYQVDIFFLPFYWIETAQSHGGSGIKDAVLAVPPDFDVKQRTIVR